MNIPVSRTLLQKQALYLAQQLGPENFKASNGFLEKYKERHGITGQVACGEKKSIDLLGIWQNYSMKHCFDTNETGFMWKDTATRTLTLQCSKLAVARDN